MTTITQLRKALQEADIKLTKAEFDCSRGVRRRLSNVPATLQQARCEWVKAYEALQEHYKNTGR